MRTSRLSFALQAVALGSLAAGVSAATVYTEVTEARQYTVEWSTDACECDLGPMGAQNNGGETVRCSFSPALQPSCRQYHSTGVLGLELELFRLVASALMPIYGVF